ncbi:MAG: HAMP domain-containing sensor histidine kinase [Eubacteriales bacterium]|nr:HAMP domain-containing sensor histidine kinase [Eubacteriales bacterium]
MFKQLHIRLTVFFTLVTSLIFLLLTGVCLHFAESSIRQSSYTSFLTRLNSVIVHLQEQDSISHQWLNQIQQGNVFRLYLYDNGIPLAYQDYHSSEEEEALVQEVAAYAKKTYNIDIFNPAYLHITSHTEFSFAPSSGQQYEVSVGIVPNTNGSLSFLVLSSRAEQNRHLTRLRCIVGTADLCAILALAVFAWRFTAHLLVPLSENQKKQMHFIASASHELRTPLSVLLSGLESIAKTRDPDKQAHFIHLMTTEGHRMQHLIDDMLLLANADSKTLPVSRKPQQPDELLLHVYEAFEPLAQQKNISFSLSLPEALLPDCLCDRERMIQVFSILTDNALCYTPAGGTITLSLLDRAHVFEFRFCDTGCGISDEQKSMIFERFYRADAAHSDKSHFGLGLCIAKELVTAQGGKIRVEDAPGGGSCFVVTLPHPQ